MIIRHRRNAGFTLTEMVVVCLIMGILAALAVPNYLKTVETTKADDAVATLNMVGTTNKMYALDHSGTYVVDADGITGAECGTGACPSDNSAQTNACVLVWCKYLADQNWDSRPYVYYTCNPGVSGSCGGNGTGNFLAGADRRSGTYTAWGYTMSINGTIAGYGAGVPTPNY